MPILSKDDFQEETFPVTIGEDLTVVCREGNLIDLVFAGAIPMPLLEVAAKLHQTLTPETAVEFMTTATDERAKLQSMLRHFAVQVAIKPRFVFSAAEEAKADDPFVLSVTRLSIQELMALFQGAQPRGKKVRPARPQEVPSDPDARHEFPVPEPAQVSAPVPDVGHLPRTPKRAAGRRVAASQ